MTAEERRLVFGIRLRELRQEKGLSQQGLADRCYGEVTKSNISRLETNHEQKPTLAVVEVLTRVLDWPVDEARQLAGYSPLEIDWSRVTASELVYVLEKYPLLSAESRQFVKEQISAIIEFLLEMEERGSSDEGRPTGITLPDNFASIELEKLIKERESDKKKRKK
jgi:transcriptional regulator with XRE-family HTH domain